MTVLKIEHKTPNYDGWKTVFDSDPIDRKKSGVKRYRIYRQTDDPDYVIIEMEFDDVQHAKDALKALRKVWSSAEGTIMFNPQTGIFNIAETHEY